MRTAVITGAGTGIGKSAALALLKDGYQVALVGRRKELLDKTAVNWGDKALVIPADLTQQETGRSSDPATPSASLLEDRRGSMPVLRRRRAGHQVESLWP